MDGGVDLRGALGGGEEHLRVRTERHATRRGQVVVISIEGDLDVAAASLVQDHLSQCFRPAVDGAGVDLLVADLGGVDFLDSSGVGALVAMRRRSAEAGSAFALCCVRAQPRQVLAITAADQLFALHPTLAGALSAVRSPVAG